MSFSRFSSSVLFGYPGRGSANSYGHAVICSFPQTLFNGAFDAFYYEKESIYARGFKTIESILGSIPKTSYLTSSSSNTPIYGIYSLLTYSSSGMFCYSISAPSSSAFPALAGFLDLSR